MNLFHHLLRVMTSTHNAVAVMYIAMLTTMSALMAQDTLISMEQLRAQVNYDEDSVPTYDLPSLLANVDDAHLLDANYWRDKRRPALKKLLQDEMYGNYPDEGVQVTYITNSDQVVFEGLARRKEVTMSVSRAGISRDVGILIYLPVKSQKPVPLFVGLNFYGNHTIHADPGISIHENWVRNREEYGIRNHRANYLSRGVSAHRWPVEQIVGAGFGLATIYYGDIDPDFDDGFQNGIHALLPADTDKSKLSSISAWAWALSKTLDYFEQDQSIDEDKVSVIGHSRLGKTSLWAGVMDERFAMVVSNDSGCGGAALSRRQFGETVHIINRSFPHWFNDRFNYYNEQVGDLPFDQHTLLALVAPRPLYVASALQDRWADPHGEFLSAKEASKVYRLFDLEGLETQTMPGANHPLSDSSVGYHMRDGKHDITAYDWSQYLLFAQRHLVSE